MVAGVPFALNHVPVKILAQQSPLTRLARLANNDRVLIILQMHGGNDGLNMLVPVDNYDTYYNRRANIAIPADNSVRKMIELDSTLDLDAQVGLHPDMQDLKDMYDRGQVSVIQGVSYKNQSGSHFRGRDIVHMGGGSEDYFSSGWIGRYLQKVYEPLQYPDDFPNEEMPDPLAIELGNDVSLVFHQEGNIPTSISLANNPEGFANLINNLEGFEDEGIDPRGRPPEFLNESPYGKELNWILDLEDKSEDYAERLVEVFNNAPASSVQYPERYPFTASNGGRNPLSSQLQLIARLLEGGVQTKVFLVRIGGFDTHANQVEAFDPTMGNHAALMYHISSAMSAFQSDLSARGIENRALTVTTSEFGRRISSNGSFGTDHGRGAPMLVFGSGATGGVIGKVPDLSPEKGNVDMQFDYRQVYSSILLDWMQLDQNTIADDIFFSDFINGQSEDGTTFEKLDIANSVITSNEPFFSERYKLEDPYPNPAVDKAKIPFFLNRTLKVRLTLLDNNGNEVKLIADGVYNSGRSEVELGVKDLTSGVYHVNIKTELFEGSKRLIVG